MKIRILRHLLFGLLTVLLLLLLIEAVLRATLSLSAGLVKNRDDLKAEYKLWQLHLFDGFMGMHQSDPQLFWRLKPGFRSSLLQTNSDGFVGPEISAPQAGEFRILFLGDSTPLGIGLANFHDSFVFQLDSILAENFPNRSIEVINAAVAGYSSWQCRRLLELEGKKLKPDLVITYFGNNDPSINGYLSDRELAEINAQFSGLKSILARSYLYQALKVFLLNVRDKEESRVLKRRVDLADYAKNLQVIADWTKDNGCKLLVCTIPTPKLWPPGIQFKVFAGGKDRQGRLVMAEEMRKDISASWSLCLDTLLLPGRGDQWVEQIYRSSYSDQDNLREAEQFYQDKLQIEENNPQYLNNLGVVKWHLGKKAAMYFKRALSFEADNPILLYNLGISLFESKPRRALEFLERARELDDYSLRIKWEYNNYLREFAQRRKILLLDLEPLFVGRKEPQFFVDHCHPTLSGHRLIAHELNKKVGKLLVF